jgi:hypothetical protein
MHCFSTHAYISAQVYLSGYEKQSLCGSPWKKELALKYTGTYISSKLFTVQYFFLEETELCLNQHVDRLQRSSQIIYVTQMHVYDII